MRITFCTTCMNYTKYLKQVYLHNLIVARDYNCDFVLVNYNSEDDMDDWIRGKDFKSFISSNKLLYYHTIEPLFWRFGHAKNVSHRLGTGDVLCNLDSDNFLTKEYLDWLFDLFSNNRNIITEGNGHGGGGRVAVYKEDFYEVGGYEEQNITIGINDHKDFVDRVCLLKRDCIQNPVEFIGYITQPSKERLSTINQIIATGQKISHKRPNYAAKGIINPNKNTGFGHCKLKDYNGNKIVLK